MDAEDSLYSEQSLYDDNMQSSYASILSLSSFATPSHQKPYLRKRQQPYPPQVDTRLLGGVPLVDQEESYLLNDSDKYLAAVTAQRVDLLRPNNLPTEVNTRSTTFLPDPLGPRSRSHKTKTVTFVRNQPSAEEEEKVSHGLAMTEQNLDDQPPHIDSFVKWTVHKYFQCSSGHYLHQVLGIVHDPAGTAGETMYHADYDTTDHSPDQANFVLAPLFCLFFISAKLLNLFWRGNTQWRNVVSLGINLTELLPNNNQVFQSYKVHQENRIW